MVKDSYSLSIFKNAKIVSSLWGRYVFSWGVRAGEFWYFFPKKVLALPCVLMQKLLTPHLQVTDKSATPHSLLHGMFHAVETSEHFACERKVFEYEYLDIECVGAETRKMRTVSVGYLPFIAEV